MRHCKADSAADTNVAVEATRRSLAYEIIFHSAALDSLMVLGKSGRLAVRPPIVCLQTG